MTKYGTFPAALVRQPGSRLSYRPDGLIEGSITFEFDWSDLNTAISNFGARHPDNESVFLLSGTVEKLKNGKGSVTYDCMGITVDPTPRVWKICSQVSTTPVQAHPKFVSDLAGTATDPKNNAQFDPDEEGDFSDDSPFRAFGSGALLGTESFYDGGPIIRSSYYTRKVPSFSKAFKLTSKPANAPRVDGIALWLYMPPEAEQVPNTNLFKVTEEFMGVAEGGVDAANLLYGK